MIDKTQGTTPIGVESPRLEGVAHGEVDLLTEPLFEGDTLGALEQLLVQMRHEDRSNTRLENVEARHHAEDQIDRQVDRMKEAADREFVRTAWQGVGKMAEGGCTAASGITGLQGASTTGSTAAKTASYQDLWKAGGQLCGATFSFVDAFQGDLMAQAERHVVRAEGAYDLATRVMDETQDDLGNANDDFRALLDDIRKLHEAEQEAQRSALFRA